MNINNKGDNNAINDNCNIFNISINHTIDDENNIISEEGSNIINNISDISNGYGCPINDFPEKEIRKLIFAKFLEYKNIYKSTVIFTNSGRDLANKLAIDYPEARISEEKSIIQELIKHHKSSGHARICDYTSQHSKNIFNSLEKKGLIMFEKYDNKRLKVSLTEYFKTEYLK